MRVIFVIGAPRSGTNMLRDIISSANDVSTWDCDELGLFWRYIEARGKWKFAQDFLRRSSLRLGSNMIVEKTCENVNRVRLINQEIKSKTFVGIVRNPMDVVNSIELKKRERFDWSYTYKKLANTPFLVLFWETWPLIKQRIILRNKSYWGVLISDKRFHCSRENSYLQWCRGIEAVLWLKEMGYTYVHYEDIVSPRFEGFTSDFCEAWFSITDMDLSTIRCAEVSGKVGLQSARIEVLGSDSINKEYISAVMDPYERKLLT